MEVDVSACSLQNETRDDSPGSNDISSSRDSRIPRSNPVSSETIVEAFRAPIRPSRKSENTSLQREDTIYTMFTSLFWTRSDISPNMDGMSSENSSLLLIANRRLNGIVLSIRYDRIHES